MSFSVDQPKKGKKKSPAPDPTPTAAQAVDILKSAIDPDVLRRVGFDPFAPTLATDTVKRRSSWLSLPVYLVFHNNDDPADGTRDFRVPSGESPLIGALLGRSEALPKEAYKDAKGTPVLTLPWGVQASTGVHPEPLPAWMKPGMQNRAFDLFPSLANDNGWRQKLSWHGETKELHEWVPKTIGIFKKMRAWGATGNVYVYIL